MYLSRLKLNPYRHSTRELRLNQYLLHQAVLRAFPDASEGGPGRVLYRIDDSLGVEAHGNLSLLIQSEKAPDWNKAGLLSESLEEPPASPRDYPPVFKLGQHLHFRLRANPTVKKQTQGRKNGFRVGLVHEEEQIKWLNRKADAGGFAIIKSRTAAEGTVRGEKSNDKDIPTHYAVIFEGTLEVTDPGLFINSIENGIGSAKGFGFGLLSVAPVKGGPT